MALVAARSSVILYDMVAKPRLVLASASMSSTVNCLAVHPNQERAYVVLPHRTAPKVEILDIKRGSATFGRVIVTVSKLPATGLGDMEGCSISAKGNVAVACSNRPLLNSAAPSAYWRRGLSPVVPLRGNLGSSSAACR